MSMPKIPNMTPDIKVTREDALNMLLSSIALEEIGLSHIINAQAENIQFALGTLENQCPGDNSLKDILEVNKAVDRTLRGVLKNQMLLQLKLEDVLDLYEKTSNEECAATEYEPNQCISNK